MSTAKRNIIRGLVIAAGMASMIAQAEPESKIWDDRPGRKWESSWYPLGNGRLGCMVDGGVKALNVQFNLDSLWTGTENISSAVSDKEADINYLAMGEYCNFGQLTICLPSVETNAARKAVSGYRRELDVSTAVYKDTFLLHGIPMRRTIFASAPDDAIYIILDGPNADKVTLALSGSRHETTKLSEDGASLMFSGMLPTNNLAYVARADVFAEAGKNRAVVILRAATGTSELAKAKFDGNADAIQKRHIDDYTRYYSRMSFDLGQGETNVPTRVRVRRVRHGAVDAPLLALQFAFGRYLLISSSRPGTLPANLQGIWNCTNNSAWHCDYHTNINLQMNYWGADAANLSECFTPLSDWMLATLPVAEAGTRAAFPGSHGYAYRTSVNALGGGGWKWNFAGAPWLAAQCYDHWLFTRDDKYLREVCWPLMQGAAEFLISSCLKLRKDGTIVVKDGWSPEHGPREDGVAHDQQIVRELFRNIIAAAKTLGIDNFFTRQVTAIEARLLKDKIGSWGQLQEWEKDRDVKGSPHRHTSHLYAVYPGSSISIKETPELAEAARVALAGRALTGDSRRSWTWPWRAALWARLDRADLAADMLHNLLQYNTLENLFATHPPFQIDGNLGMVAAVCEILLEGKIPPQWPAGSVKGLRTRDGRTISLSWPGNR